MFHTRVTTLLGIYYPILQGAMGWISGGKMASDVSNAGGLWVIAAGTMKANELRDEIAIAKDRTDKPFGVNIPLRLPVTEDAVNIVLEEKVPVVVTAAGDPFRYTAKFKEVGIKVIQLCFSVDMAKRAADAGVHAIVAMGFEAGGNLGPEELTVMSMVPHFVDATSLPIIAAGGIVDARGFLAAFALGAEGIQMGTRLIATTECTVHQNYKEMILKAKDTDTTVTGRSTGLEFRVLKNKLAEKLLDLEKMGGKRSEIDSLAVGKLGDAAIGGDMEMGSVMFGQGAGLIHEMKPIREVFEEMVKEASERLKALSQLSTF